ncbi:Uma2 family endonuclease [Thiocapsa sp.]|uniref:Uma2 family endonuclease n=1 Tax=Thiocapsa sp. TaxID=2024551 RepID=UPI0035945AF4
MQVVFHTAGLDLAVCGRILGLSVFAFFAVVIEIKENLEILFADRPDVFIAGDLLWYPVPDRRETGPIALDVLVAFGRPKGRRGSYRQWEEGGIAPQVVFEILSPSNSAKEMADKLAFYDHYGVEEYYL